MLYAAESEFISTTGCTRSGSTGGGVVELCLNSPLDTGMYLTFTACASYRLGWHLNLSLSVAFYIFIQQI